MIRQLLIKILETWLYQLKKSECEEQDLQNITSVIQKDLCVNATAADIAASFGKTPKDIHNIINRNRYGGRLRPTRKTTYNFMEMIPFIPKKWFK